MDRSQDLGESIRELLICFAVSELYAGFYIQRITYACDVPCVRDCSVAIGQSSGFGLVLLLLRYLVPV